jgi:hypothetical protein
VVLKFSATFGVIPGYGHGNIGSDAPAEKIVAAVWQQVATEVFASDGIYVSAIVHPSLTVYRSDKGCPEGGEVTATVTGCQNLVVHPEEEAYRAAVIKIITRCKELLQQATVYIEITHADTLYLRDLPA